VYRPVWKINLQSHAVRNIWFLLVHHADASRIDLIIPGEAHFYLRAATPQDRQKWVVALGSAKACVTNDIVTSHSAPASKFFFSIFHGILLTSNVTCS
jgi:hypothetical protein